MSGVTVTEVPLERPTRFEHHRYVGDKRTQVVYDLDAIEGDDSSVIDELMASERYLCFGPDTLAEARNRGYHLWKKQRRLADAADQAAG